MSFQDLLHRLIDRRSWRTLGKTETRRRPSMRRIKCECLESRRLLSVVPSELATIVIGGVLLGLFFFGRRHRVNAGMARRVGLPICLYLNKTFHASTIKSEEYSCVA